MIILGYSIYGFGNTVSKEAELKDGVNVIECSSKEEAETVRDFFVSLLYGLGGRTGGGFRKKYYPGALLRFGGELKLEVSGKQYLISAVFGRTPDGDNVRLFELPGKRQTTLPKGKTPGEFLLNVSESCFLSAISLDFKFSDNSLGYITPELMITGNENRSFAFAEKRISEHLLRIKNPEDKSGELDKLVIKKMESGNALARLSENDQKIAAEKKNLEKLKQKRRELKSRARNQQRKIEISDSCTNLLLKDKVQSIVSGLRQDETELKNLELKKEGIDSLRKIDFFKTPVIIAAASLLILLAGLILFKPLAVVGIAGLIAAAVFALIAMIKFNNRYVIVREGIKTHISAEIDVLRRKVSEEADRLCETMGGKTYGEYREIWRNAEDILRNASEDERRNAILQKNDNDVKLCAEILAEIGPVEEDIAKTQAEIDELSVNLSEAYSKASSSLEGIDQRIKELGEEYNVNRLALDVLKTTKTEISDKLLPALFGDAEKIFADAYGAEIRYFADDDFKVTVSHCDNGELTPNMIEQAKMSLETAAAKQLLVSESSIVLSLVGSLPVSVSDKRLPIDVRQVICFAY